MLIDDEEVKVEEVGSAVKARVALRPRRCSVDGVEKVIVVRMREEDVGVTDEGGTVGAGGEGAAVRTFSLDRCGKHEVVLKPPRSLTLECGAPPCGCDDGVESRGGDADEGGACGRGGEREGG